MQIIVLAGFVVAMVLVEGPALGSLGAPGWQTAPAIGVYLVGAACLGSAGTLVGLRALARCADGVSPRLGRYNLLSLAVNLWLVGGLAGVVFMGYGRWVMSDLSLAGVPLVGRLLVLAPFLGALLLAWAAAYPFYRAMRRRLARLRAPGQGEVRAWRLGQYLSYNARHNLLFFLVPVGLIVLVRDAVGLYVLPLLPDGPWTAGADFGLSGLGALGVFFFAPVLIVRIWRTRTMPDGPLRQDLEAMCRRLGFRCRDIRVWQTEGTIANAGVMGLAPAVRYVVLSDGLLEQMEAREVRAIFAHEAGHVVGHHIFYSILFILATVTIAGLLAAELALSMHLGYTGEMIVALGLTGAVWCAGFGWLSRRFERHSDVLAAWAIGQEEAGALPGDPAPAAQSDRIPPEGAVLFARSLERVAALNGIPPRQRNWRHGSIAARVAYVLWLGSLGTTRAGFERGIRRIKRIIWLLTAVAGAVWWLQGMR